MIDVNIVLERKHFNVAIAERFGASVSGPRVVPVRKTIRAPEMAPVSPDYSSKRGSTRTKA